MLGSDDIVCSKLLDVYTPSMEKGIDLIGLIDCYFLDARDSTLKYWKGYTNHRIGESIGMARMMSKDLLERMNWNVWSKGLKKGLDSSMMRNLRSLKPFGGERLVKKPIRYWIVIMKDTTNPMRKNGPRSHIEIYTSTTWTSIPLGCSVFLDIIKLDNLNEDLKVEQQGCLWLSRN